MTEYSSWTRDFPKRAMRLHQVFHERSRSEGLEVTLLLSITASVIIIPRERGTTDKPMCDLSGMSGLDHTRLRDVLDAPIGDNPFLTPTHQDLIASIRFGTDVPDPLDWRPDKHARRFGRQKNFGTLINHLRNAFAHGNLLVRGHRIDEVVFFQRSHMAGSTWSYLQLRPAELLAVCQCWMRVLNLVHDVPYGPELLSQHLNHVDQDWTTAA